MHPLVKLIEKDTELEQLTGIEIGTLANSSLLIAQDVVYKLFDRNIITIGKERAMANSYGHEEEEDKKECEFYQELANLLRFKKNIIIEGAPGVGKTYELYRIITRLCHPELKYAPDDTLRQAYNKLKAERRIKYVTFHQKVDYEEFVEGLRPHTNEDGSISYDVKSGIFKQMCINQPYSAWRKDNPYTALLD